MGCALCLGLLLLWLAGCAPLPAPTQAAPTQATPPQAAGRWVIYAPATPATAPILLAAARLPGAEVVIFTNHAQANAAFLRGDADMLVTGLSVGVDLFKNGAPVQIVNSYVAGMTYLVTAQRRVTGFADLRGETIYLPFEGSPIEETTRFLAEQAGLRWGQDLRPVYAPFASAVALLKQGRATAVALPEPSVALIEGTPGLFVSLSYRAEWDRATAGTDGYPQVTPFVKRAWAAQHEDLLARFNTEVAAALAEVAQNPAAAVAATQDALGLPAAVLAPALARTDFAFVSGDALADAVRAYYRTIGKPLDDSFDAFFRRDPQ